MASLYGRNNLSGILQRTAADVFIPVTAGGGVRSVQDVAALLRAGADKVAVNTAALRSPALMRGQVPQAFGRQCMVLSMQAKRRAPGAAGRRITTTGASTRAATPWRGPREGAALGAGEILLTSVDCRGLPPRHGRGAGGRGVRGGGRAGDGRGRAAPAPTTPPRSQRGRGRRGQRPARCTTAR